MSPGRGTSTSSRSELSQLRPGERGRVRQLDPRAPEPTTRRLRDLGFAPGAEVQAVRRAPLGDPVVYRVAGSELSLRRSEARVVHLEPEVDQ